MGTYDSKCETGVKDIGILLPLYLKIKGEPFNWSIRDKDLGEFLKSNGYELKSSKTPTEFKYNYITDDYKSTIHMAENIAIADGVV